MSKLNAAWAPKLKLSEYPEPWFLLALGHLAKRQGWYRNEVANRAGINQTTIESWFHRATSPKMEYMRRVAALFGKSFAGLYDLGQDLLKEQERDAMDAAIRTGEAIEFFDALEVYRRKDQLGWQELVERLFEQYKATKVTPPDQGSGPVPIATRHSKDTESEDSPDLRAIN